MLFNIDREVGKERWGDFFKSFDAVTATTTKIVKAFPIEIYDLRPGGRFGPAEQLIHVIQSERFALDFILRGLDDMDMKLQEPFASIVAIEDPKERHTALSALNLKGARKELRKFLKEEDGFSNLKRSWIDARSNVRSILSAIKPEAADMHIVHPLVPTLQGNCIFMCNTLFVRHHERHMGQITEAMNQLGYAHLVPFPYGDFV